MRCLLRALFFLVGLVIYAVPGIVFWGYVLSDMSHYPRSYGYSNGIDGVLTLLVFVGGVLIMPVVIFGHATAWVNPMIPIGTAVFLIVAYGCLVFLYLRSSKKRAC